MIVRVVGTLITWQNPSSTWVLKESSYMAWPPYMNVGGIHLQHTTNLHLTCLVGGFSPPIWKKICASQIGSFHFSKWGEQRKYSTTPPSCTFTGLWREKTSSTTFPSICTVTWVTCWWHRFCPVSCFASAVFSTGWNISTAGGHCNACGVTFSFYTEFSMCNPRMLRNLWNMYLHVWY